MSYLKNIFPLLKEAGATALLIEYEDMFPYFGPLRNISAKNAFTTQDIQTMLTWASQVHEMSLIVSRIMTLLNDSFRTLLYQVTLFHL